MSATNGTSEPLRVLVIDDDKALAETIAESLERRGHACTVCTSGKTGAAKLEEQDFDVVLTDLKMADLGGLEVVKRSRQSRPDAEVFVITGFGDVKTAVEAMKLGASHYLQKPLDLAELRAVVDKSAERARTVRDLRRQIDEKFGFEGVVGNGPQMRRVLQLLRAYAPTSASVLVLGENGTGKELVAKALHANSPRKAKPFVAMNCAALNENLLDDEMFGHEDGAYTGSKGQRKGRFEHAHGGTLFLDEIGDMPLSLQAKLLRVLENGEVVHRGERAVTVDVRVIAATNRDLDAAVKEGRFRLDLYHRLKVGTIRLPIFASGKRTSPARYPLPEGAGEDARQACAEGRGRGVEGFRVTRLARQREGTEEPFGEHAASGPRRLTDARRPARGRGRAALRDCRRRGGG